MIPIDKFWEKVEKLRALGLTEYRARVYLVLSTTVPMEARDIANESRVPRTKIYSVLDDLRVQGLVEMEATRPKQYRKNPIDVLVATMVADHEKQISALMAAGDEFDDGERPPEETEAVWQRRKICLIALAAAYGVPDEIAHENAKFLTRFKPFVVDSMTQDQQVRLAAAFLEGSPTLPDYHIGEWVQLILRGDPNQETYKDLKRFLLDSVPGDVEKFHSVLKANEGRPKPIAASR